ncbi:hypothetical protein DSO57_1011906 [Entomophthora muscae]|uniref:Uncharacterized protein n=1 Tax=Entomophthora muscae TaxID=34485 RepID=A0ACC2SIX9_9FUNG|nr:hypothetical protein DSO57_1011906 [Entomophthora muscae]
MNTYNFSSYTGKLEIKFSPIFGSVHPANFCLAILAIGYLRSQLDGKADAEILRSPTLLRFKRQRKMLHIPVWPKRFNQGILQILAKVFQENQVRASNLDYVSLCQLITTAENAASALEPPASKENLSSSVNEITPLGYLNYVLFNLDFGTLNRFYNAIHSMLYGDFDVDKPDVFRESEFGLFLREQVCQFENMEFVEQQGFIEKVEEFISEDSDILTTDVSLKEIDRVFDEAIARLKLADIDLETAFDLVFRNLGGDCLSGGAKLLFVRYLDCLAAGDFEASFNSLNKFFEGGFVVNSEFSALNLGILNYNFRYDGVAADFFIEVLQIAARNDNQACMDLGFYWIVKLGSKTDNPIVRDKIKELLGSHWHVQLLEQLIEDKTPHAAACRTMLNYEMILQGRSPQSVISSSNPNSMGHWEHYGKPALTHASNLSGKQDQHLLLLAERLMDAGQAAAVGDILQLIKTISPTHKSCFLIPAWKVLELRLQFEQELACGNVSKAQMTLANLEDILFEHRLYKTTVHIYQARLLSVQNDPSRAMTILYDALANDSLLSYSRLLLNFALFELFMSRGRFTEAISIAYAALELCRSGSHFGEWTTASLALADAMASSSDDFTGQAQIVLAEIEDKIGTPNPWFNLIQGKIEMTFFNKSADPQQQKIHIKKAIDHFQKTITGFSKNPFEPKLQVAKFFYEAATRLYARLEKI